jgi:hypothetical protein
MATFSSMGYALAVLALALGIFKGLQVGPQPKGIPPGPLTLPITGNIHQFPKEDLHVKLKE